MKTSQQTNSFVSPDCFICINKNRVKTHGDKIFFHDKTEFQIELRNNDYRKIKASFELNGKKWENELVVRPYEKLYLERFLDTDKKLLFDIYTVEDNVVTKAIIKDNGKIKIAFFAEIVPFVPPVTWTYTSYPYNNFNLQMFDSNIRCDSNENASLYPCNSITSRSISPDSGKRHKSFSKSATILKSEIETGRVAEGEVSNQKFVTVEYEFEKLPFCIYEYELLPASKYDTIIDSEPTFSGTVTTNSGIYNDGKLSRQYCTTCGRRAKDGWIFCPGCGKSVRS